MGDFNNLDENTNQQPLDNQNSDQPQSQGTFQQQPNDQPYGQPQDNQPKVDQPQYDQLQYQQPQYNQYQQTDPYQNQYQYQPQEEQYQTKQSNGMAIASMVCGIISFITSCCLWFLALPLAIVSVVLGIIVLNKKKGAKAMAIVGIVLSGISIIIAIIVIIASFSFMNNTDFMNYYQQFYNGIESEY